MPSKSKAQHNFMAAVANNPQFARRAGVPQSVGREYMKADRGRSFNEGGDLVSNCGTKRMKKGGKPGYHRMPDGTMMKDSEHKGYKSGGKLQMVTNDEGERVPFYAADGKGAMAYGGKVKGMKRGGGVRGDGICQRGRTRGTMR